MDGWRDRQAAARAAGRHVGIGLSMLVQGTAPTQYGVAGRFGSFEAATVAVLPDGSVTVTVGTKSQGQAHETVLAQVAATRSAPTPSAVTVRDGDTDALPYGMGTWGSRSAVMGGGAVLQAAGQVRRSVDRIAACLPGTAHLAEWPRPAWLQPHTLPPDLAAPLAATAVFSPGGTIPVPDEHGHTNFDETSAASATALGRRGRHGDGPRHGARRRAGVGLRRRHQPPPSSRASTRAGSPRRSGAALTERLALRRRRHRRWCGPSATTPRPPRSRCRCCGSSTARRPRPCRAASEASREASITSTPAALAGAVADALAPLGVRITSSRLHPAHLRALLREAGHVPDVVAFARG